MESLAEEQSTDDITHGLKKSKTQSINLNLNNSKKTVKNQKNKRVGTAVSTTALLCKNNIERTKKAQSLDSKKRELKQLEQFQQIINENGMFFLFFFCFFFFVFCFFNLNAWKCDVCVCVCVCVAYLCFLYFDFFNANTENWTQRRSFSRHTKKN